MFNITSFIIDLRLYTVNASTMMSAARALRILSCATVTAVMGQKVAYAEDDLRARLDKANTRDMETTRMYKIEEVMKWEAVKDNAAFKQYLSKGIIDDYIINELFWMTSFYKKPLPVYRKIWARNKLATLYESTQNAEEKAFLVNIMHYFELFE